MVKVHIKSIEAAYPLFNIITPAIKYLKVVIPRRLDRSPRRLAWGEGIQKELDTPIKSEYDMFLLFNCAVIISRLMGIGI